MNLRRATGFGNQFRYEQPTVLERVGGVLDPCLAGSNRGFANVAHLDVSEVEQPDVVPFRVDARRDAERSTDMVRFSQHGAAFSLERRRSCVQIIDADGDDHPVDIVAGDAAFGAAVFPRLQPSPALVPETGPCPPKKKSDS